MSSYENSVDGKLKQSDGDWVCTDEDCRNVNFARRSHCNRCNKEKVCDVSTKKKIGTEIGKAAAEKSRGLFSAEDWQCSKCANVNWARRQTCNMCNAPKFCDVEERTGYGGGYNDRGIVEYKEREDSDSEYDEFGRKKKSQGTSRKSIGKNKTSDTKNNSSDDDDDEDDDEDGGDLSKYALFDSDDESKTLSASNSKRSRSGSSSSSSDRNSRTKSKTRSRSRSRSLKKLNQRTSRSRSRSRDRNNRRRSSSRSSGHSRSRRRSHSRSRSRSKSYKKHSRSSRSSSKRKRSNSKSRSRSLSPYNAKQMDYRK